jgi:NADPH:quinone reductase-like Zn-dependent oxidoreductase
VPASIQGTSAPVGDPRDTEEGKTMKALVNREYGLPDVLSIEEVAKPVPSRKEALVRVVAASVNPGDWDLMQGTPYLLRLLTGIRRPRNAILGLAIAGRVEVVGADVSRVQVGDEVYAGIARGGFAEFASVSENALAPKPSNLTFEQAAAVPVAGIAALQALRNIGRVRSGQKVLINGAAGGVGTFAVQIAKVYGAEVTGVSSTNSLELVRSIGADHVIDYTVEDFTAGGARYDLILDNVGNRSLSELRRALVPRGTLIPNSNKGGGPWVGSFLRRAVLSLLVSPFVTQRLRPFASRENGEDLSVLKELIESGQVTPVIERTFPLTDAAEALDHYGAGHARGKIVITVTQDEPQERGGESWSP